MNQFFWESNVPFRHSKFLPNHNKNDVWGNLYKSIAPQIKKGFLITIVGPRGSGKTQLGTCLIWYCAHKAKKSARYTKIQDIYSKNRTTEEWFDPHLLVIDNLEEFGTIHYPGLINHILDVRYEKEKATIILSNDTMTVFEDKMNESNLDRMREQGGIVELNLPSFRNL